MVHPGREEQAINSEILSIETVSGSARQTEDSTTWLLSLGYCPLCYLVTLTGISQTYFNIKGHLDLSYKQQNLTYTHLFTVVTNTTVAQTTKKLTHLSVLVCTFRCFYTTFLPKDEMPSQRQEKLFDHTPSALA